MEDIYKKGFIYEVDPYKKQIKKLPLNRDIKLKLGQMKNFHINHTEIYIYGDDTFFGSDGVIADSSTTYGSTYDDRWILDLPDLPTYYKGSFKQLYFRGVCYLAGQTYKIGDNGEWKVLRFPEVYSNFFEKKEISPSKNKLWIKFE